MNNKTVLTQVCCGLIVTGALLLPQLLLAANATDKGVIMGKSSDLAKGINQDMLNKCIYSYDLKGFKTSLLDPEFPNLLKTDLNGEFKDKDYCDQAAAMLKIGHALPAPQSIKVYDNITVYYALADSKGTRAYYMVDNKGQVLQLTNAIDITNSKGFPDLVSKYPPQDTKPINLQMTAQGYPTSTSMPDGMMRLTFKQDVTYGHCLPCKVIGTANTAYDFDKDGVYLQTEVLNIITQ